MNNPTEDRELDVAAFIADLERLATKANDAAFKLYAQVPELDQYLQQYQGIRRQLVGDEGRQLLAAADEAKRSADGLADALRLLTGRLWQMRGTD